MHRDEKGIGHNGIDAPDMVILLVGRSTAPNPSKKSCLSAAFGYFAHHLGSQADVSGSTQDANKRFQTHFVRPNDTLKIEGVASIELRPGSNPLCDLILNLRLTQ